MKQELLDRIHKYEVAMVYTHDCNFKPVADEGLKIIQALLAVKADNYTPLTKAQCVLLWLQDKSKNLFKYGCKSSHQAKLER